jgi:hypothetical protein
VSILKDAVVAIFREEAPFLDEWLRFHDSVGVGHFNLYNNFSTERHQHSPLLTLDVQSCATIFATKSLAEHGFRWHHRPAKHKHLLNRGGRYWARMSIPGALRPILSKRELLEPLEPDHLEAIRKLPGASVVCTRPALRLPRNAQLLSLRNVAKAQYKIEIALDDDERAVDPSTYADTDPVRRQEAVSAGL